jgi:hypothetical protein
MVIWGHALSHIDRLLVIKQEWASASKRDCNVEREGDHDSSAARSKCMNAVMDDWRDVLKSSKRTFFDYFVGRENNSQLYEGADLTAGLGLIWNLSGTKVQKKQSRDHEMTAEVAVLRVGGIAQSLCQHQECTNCYIAGSIVDYSGDVNVADLVSALEGAIQMSFKSDNDTCFAVSCTIQIHQISAIRAFVSWLGKCKKNLRELTKASTCDSDLIDKAVSILMSCLRLESKVCVNMSLAAL